MTRCVAAYIAILVFLLPTLVHGGYDGDSPDSFFQDMNRQAGSDSKRQAGGRTFEKQLATMSISQAMVNRYLSEFVITDFLRWIQVELKREGQQIILRGQITIPEAYRRLVKADESKLSDFYFQSAVNLTANAKGSVILTFTPQQTYIWPAGVGKPREEEKFVVPVYFLELCLALARGHLAILAGDMSVFDRQGELLAEDLAELRKKRAAEQGKKAADDKERASKAFRLRRLDRKIKKKRLSVESLALTREDAEDLWKFIDSRQRRILDFNIDVNELLEASKNSVILKLHLGDLFPYLKDIQLSAIRIIRVRSGSVHLNIDVGGWVDRGN